MRKSVKTIFMNLCMIYDDDGNILVQDRTSSFWSGITFPGGHIENGESFADSVIREVFEETGLTIRNPKLCGLEDWQDEKGKRQVVLFYKTNSYSGELKSSDEGKVFWIKRKDLTNYKLSNDFEKMIEVFENDDISEFFYYKNSNNEREYKML